MQKNFRERMQKKSANRTVLKNLLVDFDITQKSWIDHNNDAAIELKDLFDTISELDTLELIHGISKKEIIEKQLRFISKINEVILREQLNLDRNENKIKVYNDALSNIDSFQIFVKVNYRYLDIILEDIYNHYEEYRIDLMEFLYYLRTITKEQLEEIFETVWVVERILKDCMESDNLELVEQGLFIFQEFPRLFNNSYRLIQIFLDKNKYNVESFKYMPHIQHATEVLKTVLGTFEANKKDKTKE